MFYKALFYLLLIINCIVAVDQSLRSSRSVLYVWSGQDASVANASDFVAVVDFDPKSKTYGQIIRTVSLLGNSKQKISQTGNEPHHAGVSSNGRLYITGGLLSFLSGSREIFVWKLLKNRRLGPKFAYALDVPAACPDEFVPIGGPRFIVSMMCNESAVSPGNMVYINARLRIARPIMKDLSSVTDFNPHGFSRLNNGSLFVADYIEPLTLTGTNLSGLIFRNTARHILPNGKIERIFEFQLSQAPNSSTGVGQGIGFMDLKTIPGDPYARSYVCGTNANLMYLIGPGMPEPIVAIDLSQVNSFVKIISAGLSAMFPNGKRMLVTFQMRFIILLNITTPETPTILRVFDFCTDPSIENMTIQHPDTSENTTFPQFCAENNNVAGPHFVTYPKGENRFVVVNYFLKFGLAQFSGTRSLHAFKLNKDLTDFRYDHKFNPNFRFDDEPSRGPKTFNSLKAYPHHAQYLRY